MFMAACLTCADLIDLGGELEQREAGGLRLAAVVQSCNCFSNVTYVIVVVGRWPCRVRSPYLIIIYPYRERSFETHAACGIVVWCTEPHKQKEQKKKERQAGRLSRRNVS